MSSPGIEPRLLALQTSMHPLYYGTLPWMVQKLFDSDCKRVGQKEPPPGVKRSKHTSDPIGLKAKNCGSFTIILILNLDQIFCDLLKELISKSGQITA